MLVRSVIEIEIVAVGESFRQRGIATTLLRHAEDQFAQLGLRYIVAKVDAAAMPTLRWYRHRGYTLAREGEHLAIEISDGAAGLDAGGSNRWRLAAKGPATPSRDTAQLCGPTWPSLLVDPGKPTPLGGNHQLVLSLADRPRTITPDG